MKSILSSIAGLPGGIEVIDAPFPLGEIVRLGLPRSAQLPLIASLKDRTSAPFLILTDKTRRALDLWDEFNLWLPESNPYFFPEPTALFYEDLPWGENTRRERLAALAAITRAVHEDGRKQSSPVVFSPARALMARTIPPEIYRAYFRTFQAGSSANPESIARDLVSMGYEPANTVSAV
ncbi:MAG: hypothetical protein OEV06_09260, partial [Anaerolineae bacterium]|nr:hypothetical protein [Anaerolineae bacterium]